MKTTPLYHAHLAASGKIIEFAGYQMPVQYPLGLAKEHLWVRAHAGIFDVSHMGQIWVKGAGAGVFLSRITPSDITKLADTRAKYTVLTNEQGGIIDDLIITRVSEDTFFVVVNGACKDKDFAWMKSQCPADVSLELLPDTRALIALQGPSAESVLQALVTVDVVNQPYMSFQYGALKDGTEVFISRLGYTGEDGFEISVPADKAEPFWNALSAHPEVEPIGLGARDTLRLEMGYPLYGHDLNDETSPIEANIGWIINKGHTGFVGEQRILAEKEQGPSRKRVAIKLLDKGVAREGAILQDVQGNLLGALTSGGVSPSLSLPIGQAYVPAALAAEGTKLQVVVRDRVIPAEVCGLAFMPAKTKTTKKVA